MLYGGFVIGDSVSDLISVPKVINNNVDAGVYTLTPTGGESLNYNFLYFSNTLTIKKSDYNMSNVSLTNQTFVYDGLKKNNSN